jgi:transposase-like protein
MGKKGHTVEFIVAKLGEAEVLMAKGQTIEEAVRQLGISDATYYKWRKEYGGLQIDQAKRYKVLEQENQRLRKVVADLTIDNSILKEASQRSAGRLKMSRSSFKYQNVECVRS